MQSKSSTRNLLTIREVINDFDGFIIDQFGVLHDGTTPYSHAINTLQQLMDAGKFVTILSNSGKRSDINIKRMAQLGFKRSLFSKFVTSGDVAFSRVQSDYVTQGLNRCLLIARDGDTSAIAGLNVELVNDTDNCDFIVISASEGDKYSEQHYVDILKPAAQRGLPCLCTNPDKLMLTRAGVKFGAGRIAELYERMNGSVEWIGKPFQSVYAHALRYSSGIPHKRILCIGDSIEHDVAGGANAGLKTLFIRGGIHREMDDEQIAYYTKTHQAIPDFQMLELC